MNLLTSCLQVIEKDYVPDWTFLSDFTSELFVAVCWKGALPPQLIN